MCPFFLGKTVCVCICAPCRLCRGALFCCQKGARFRILSRKGVSCESKKQLSNVYLYTFFSTFTITDAVWVALLAARGFTLAQIGLAGAGLCVLGGAVLLSGLAVAGKTRYNGGRAG